MKKVTEALLRLGLPHSWRTDRRTDKSALEKLRYLSAGVVKKRKSYCLGGPGEPYVASSGTGE